MQSASIVGGGRVVTEASKQSNLHKIKSYLIPGGGFENHSQETHWHHLLIWK